MVIVRPIHSGATECSSRPDFPLTSVADDLRCAILFTHKSCPYVPGVPPSNYVHSLPSQSFGAVYSLLLSGISTDRADNWSLSQ